jgi:hypothetical protein
VFQRGGSPWKSWTISVAVLGSNHAAAKKFDVNVLLQARLAPDLFPLATRATRHVLPSRGQSGWSANQ